MFDQTLGARRKIAIVGGGISGLSAAYYLSPQYDVTLFEAAPRLGGHARTVMAGRNGNQPVDTGFIVFNYATYPYLTRLFQDLDVPVIKSEMSFAASIDDGRLEYGMNNLAKITAQRSNLVRPHFYKMIADIIRFGKHAEAAAQGDDFTIGDLVGKLGLGHWFRDKYLIPMCGAIWSTPVAEVDKFPARSLVRFFRNHALLAGMDQHQWWTVRGGSIEYVRRLESALIARGVKLHTGAPVFGAQRSDCSVEVVAKGFPADHFDELIFACHSDQALAILGGGATAREATALGAVRYQSNRVVLHRDPDQMPRRRNCWSSWNFLSKGDASGVTYWMNRLQGIPDDNPLFVTLNPYSDIPDQAIYDEVEFAHPVFDNAAIKAQRVIRQMQGENRTWFAGAWNRYGFHEDGIASAMRIVRTLTDLHHSKGISHARHGQGSEIQFPVDVRASA